MSFSPAILVSLWASLATQAGEPGAPPVPLPPPAPFQSQVTDPLLAPPPAASFLVGGWDEAIGMVRRGSTSERSAAAEVERAEARSRQALAALLPNARLNATAVLDARDPGAVPPVAIGTPSEDAVPTAPLGTASVSVTQSLVDVAAWRGLDAARASARGASESLAEVRRRLTQSLARSLVSVAAAERVAELNRLGLRQALEREALTRRSLELGAATQLDLVRVSQDVEVARGALVAGDEQLRRVREALGLALGLDHDAGLGPGFQLQALVDETITQCERLGQLADRPDLAAARAQVAAARASRLQALAGYLPTLGLSTSLFGYTSDPGPGRLGSWTVSAVLSVPLWEGGLRGAAVRERRGAETQAEQTLEQVRRDLSIESGRARRGIAVAESLLASATSARALAERTDQLTRRSFEVGRSGSLELVQSASALRQADANLAAREFELAQARVDEFLTEATCDW